jgi:hypothetical protein
MAIKRWNASTSQWELVGTPGTASPSAIGAAGLVGGNTLTGNQYINGLLSVRDPGGLLVNTEDSWASAYFRSAQPNNKFNGLLFEQSRGTLASPLATGAGDSLGFVRFNGYRSSSSNGTAAQITGLAASNWTSTNSEGFLTFTTTPNGSVIPVERMRIDSAGKVGIGTTAPAAKLHIDNTGGGQSPLRVKPPTGGYNALELVSGYTGNMSWGLNDAGGSGAMYFYQYDSAGSYARTPLTIESSGTFTLSYVDASAPVLYNTANNNNKLMVFEGYASNKWNLWGGHGGGSYFGISENASSTPVFAITGSTNYVLVGYTASQGAYRLQVNSQIFATSSSIATSDGRYKENVLPITSGLDIIDSLNPVSFDWKEHPVHNFVEGKTVGFIAQEVQEALADYEWVDNIIKTNTTEAVLDEEGNEITPSEEFLGIAESNIIPLLVAAVKELRAEVNTLKAQLSN